LTFGNKRFPHFVLDYQRRIVLKRFAAMMRPRKEMKMDTFKGIRAGDTVWYKDRDGKTKKAKVNRLLIFNTHVVLNVGNNGLYVNEENYVRHGIYV
jgi:hypothetical protein